MFRTHLTPSSRAEAQAFFRDAYPFPVTAFVIAVFFLGDVAVTLAGIVAMG